MNKDMNQILENTAIPPPVLKLANNSCENEDTELINYLIDFYMLNIGELSSLLNQVLSDLSVIEKKAIISFLNNISKNLSDDKCEKEC